MPAPSYFPRWTLREGGTVAPDERLPAAQTIALGAQHVVAMFGATVLAPLLMGFDPNVAIFFSGIGTLVFFAAVAGRVPSYLGSSFSFIAVVIAATAYAGSGPNANMAAALGGIVACGGLYAAIGLVVMKVGYAWIETLMPPVVTGAIVAVIGLNLAPIAVKGISGSASTRGSASRPSSRSASSPCARPGCCGACPSSSARSRATCSTRSWPTGWGSARRSTSRRSRPPPGSGCPASPRRNGTRRRSR
jgi:xanthine/uracil permease